METNEKPKNPNDPKEYEAMPRGGWKLAAGVSIALLALLPCFTMWVILLGWLPASLADLPTRIILSFGAFEGLAIAWFTFFASANQWPKPWLVRYWHRNVRGYVVAHYTEQGRAKHSEPFLPLSYKEDEVDAWLWASPNAHFVVCWPLGGWFHRPTTWWRAKSSGWSVARDTRFPGTPVKVTDKNGSSLRFAKIEDAISFIADRLERAATQPFWQDSSDMPFSWLQVLEGLSEDRDDARRDRELDRSAHAQSMDALFRALDAATGQAAPPTGGDLTDWLVAQVRRLVAERDAARGEVDRHVNGFLPAAVKDRDAARQEREEAAAFIAELEQRFVASTRLYDKLQALRIHERVREWLYFHRFPTAWETAVANVNQQHDADAGALAEVRTRIKKHERRDRTRHGRTKPAAPPVGSTA